MTRDIKVSVLTPIYNHKIEYVRECLESLRAQTMQDIEFILIDNGSTIESKDLISEYEQADSRFRVIHLKENQGYGRAMNIGLKCAKGEYIGILESDDFAQKNTFEYLYKLALKKNVDVVKSDYSLYYGKTQKSRPRKNFNKKFCNHIISPSAYPELFLSDPAIWSAIYSKQFLLNNNISFLENKEARYQDTSFNFYVMAKASRVYIINKTFIFYRHDNSNSSIRDINAISAVPIEFHAIDNFLDQNSEIKNKLIYVKNYIKFRTYKWNYYRATGEVKENFKNIFKREFLGAFLNKEIDRTYFNDDEALMLAKLIGVKNIGHFANNNINICFTFDSNVFYQTCVAISSLLDRAQNKVFYNIYCVVSNDIDIDKKDQLRNLVKGKSIYSNISFFQQETTVDKGYVTRGITTAAYSRLFLHRTLPDVNWIIYSDIDVLFNTDLSELMVFNEYFSNKEFVIGAVKDISINRKESWDYLCKYTNYWDRYFAKVYPNYILSGFLVMNLDKIRALNWDSEVKNLLTKEFMFQDQDILNIILPINNIYYLPSKYITMLKHYYTGLYEKAKSESLISEKEYFEVFHNPAIYHWAGPKPWNNPKEKYSKIWWKYVNKNRKYSKIFRINNFITQPDKCNYKIFENIFSIKNNDRKTHKKITILGIKFSVKRNQKENVKQKENFEERLRSVLREEVSNVVAREVSLALSVQKLHMQTFPPFKNIHNNQSVAIIGCGPSIKYYNGQLNTVNIALNKAIFLDNINFDYLFTWDYLGFQEKAPDFFDRVKKYNCKKFYGKFLADNLSSIPEFSDDEENNIYHFYSSARHKLPAYSYGEIIHYDIETHPLADFMSISFGALHFALYTRPEKIYLIGLDTQNCGHYAGDNNTYNINKMMLGYKKFKTYIETHYPDVEIISVNPVGLKGLFKDVYTKEYVDAHPELFDSLEDIEILDNSAEKEFCNV